MSLVLQSYSLEGLNLKFYSFIHPETGELWVTGTDIARSLGYENPSDYVYRNIKNESFKRKWCDLVKGLRAGQTPLNWQKNTTMINEGGIHRLVMSCNLENLDRFKDWVCGEVLPSIRKSGAYISSGMSKDQIDELILLLHRKENQLADTVTRLQQSHDQIMNLSNDILKMKPRVAIMPHRVALQHTIRIYKHHNKYIFIRPQGRNLKYATRKADINNFNLIFKRDGVPNSMNILNKIKERLNELRIKYTSKQNTITPSNNINIMYIINDVCKQ